MLHRHSPGRSFAACARSRAASRVLARHSALSLAQLQLQIVEHGVHFHGASARPWRRTSSGLWLVRKQLWLVRKQLVEEHADSLVAAVGCGVLLLPPELSWAVCCCCLLASLLRW